MCIILRDVHIFPIFKWNVICQIIITHHDTCCMDRGLTRVPFNFFRNFKSFLIFQLTVNNLTKRHILFISRCQIISKTNFTGNIGQFILWNTITFKNITNRLLSSKGRIGHDLSCMHGSITIADIADKFRAIDIGNININIRHSITFQI